ncbi:MAG: hypothetical protein AAF092_10610 [Pseudomonadota bacterium]
MRILSVLLVLWAAAPASAATIGSLDGYRMFGSEITGSNYDALRAGLELEGHSFAAETRSLNTAGYLDGVDAVFHSRAGASVSRTYPEAGEVDALRQWVTDGGVFVMFGGNFQFASDLNRWVGAFGFNYVSRNVSGGTWASDPHPLLTGIVPGADLNFRFSSWVNHNAAHVDPNGGDVDPEVFATISGDGATQNAILGAQYGDGYILVFGDENPVFDGFTNPDALTLIDNVLS